MVMRFLAGITTSQEPSASQELYLSQALALSANLRV